MGDPVRMCRHCGKWYADPGPGRRRGVPAGYCRKLCHRRAVAGRKRRERARRENRQLALHARQCRYCGEGRRLQAHHCVTQAELRRIAAGRDPDQSRIYAAKLCADYRNLIPLCPDCHHGHHARTRPLPLSVLPDSVFAFARQVMGDGRAYEWLRRYYVGEDPRLDELLKEAA